MKKTYTLHSEPRTSLGHAASRMRKDKRIPAVAYGSGLTSKALSVDKGVFTTLYSEAGETHVVQLETEGVSIPVLIHSVQKHPVTKEVLHVEFLKVNLKEKMKTFVPVEIEGVSPAVEQNLGTLMVVLQEIEIEALPTEIPESIKVDVSSLIEVNQELRVADLPVVAGVSYVSQPDETLVKVGAIVIEQEPIAAEEDLSEEAQKETTETTSQPTETNADAA